MVCSEYRFSLRLPRLAHWDFACSIPAMAQPYPTIIPGLRSPSAQVKGLVYFGRMLDKIRLAADGTLPEGWQRCAAQPIKALSIPVAAVSCTSTTRRWKTETLKGRSDEELLEWAFANGRRPTDDEVEIWNSFMTKRGWRDAGTQRLNERLAEIGLPAGTVLTMFEFIDARRRDV
jgi:gluconokinase